MKLNKYVKKINNKLVLSTYISKEEKKIDVLKELNRLYDFLLKIKELNYEYHYEYEIKTKKIKNEIQINYSNKSFKEKIKDGFDLFLKNPLSPSSQATIFMKNLLKNQEEEYKTNKEYIYNIFYEISGKTKHSVFYSTLFKQKQEIYSDNVYYSLTIDQISHGLLSKLREVEDLKLIKLEIKNSYLEDDRKNIYKSIIEENFSRNRKRDKVILDKFLKDENNNKIEDITYKTMINDVFKKSKKEPFLHVKLKIEFKENVDIYKKILLIDFLKEEGIVVSNKNSSFYPITIFDFYSMFA